jgi:hypothetical protein
MLKAPSLGRTEPLSPRARQLQQLCTHCTRKNARRDAQVQSMIPLGLGQQLLTVKPVPLNVSNIGSH